MIGHEDKILDLQKRLLKINKELNHVDRPVLKKLNEKGKKVIDSSSFDTVHLNNPENIYWTEKAREFETTPSLLYKKVLNKTFKFSDTKFNSKLDENILKGVEIGKSWLEIGLNIKKHPFACLRRYSKIVDRVHEKWTFSEDLNLLNAVNKHSSSNWDKIALTFDNKTSYQCRRRYIKLQTCINKGKWTQDEDRH